MAPCGGAVTRKQRVGDEKSMSDNEKKKIQWADLNSYKKRYIESMEDGLGRTWLWMYFSGFSVEDIAAEYSCSKTRVYISLKTNIEKYNQFLRDVKEKVAQIQAKKTEAKQVSHKQTGGSTKTGHEQAASKPVMYRPKKQSQRVYSKLRKRIYAQFDKKFYIGDIQVSQEEYAELLEYVRVPQANARMFDMEGDYAARLFKIPMCVYTRNDFSVKSPALLDVIRLGNLTRWDLEFVEGDVLIFSDGKSLVAGERYVEGLTKRGIVSEAVHHDNDGKNVPVYNRVPDLLLTLSKERVSGTVIDINGSRYRLSECDNDDFEAGDARGVRAFLIPLAQFPECSEGTVNRIIIDAPGSTYAREYLFVYVQDLKTKFDGAPYVFEERGTLVFPENIRVTCNNPDAERLHGENGFQFLLSQELRTIPIQINNSITVNFEVPMFLWSSDEKEWKTEPMGDVWHSDFKALRKLYFHSPNDRLEFSMDDDYDDSDDQSEQHVVSCEKRSDGAFVLDLG